MTFPAFKAGDAVLRGPGGGFDFHTLPPHLFAIQRFDFRARERKGTTMDPEFAADLREIINSRKPLDLSAWE